MGMSSLKANVVRKIEENIIRGDIVDGVYSSATFEYGRNTFELLADVYDENGVRIGSGIYKNGEVCSYSIVSEGRYANVYIGDGISLMEHQLLAICLVPGATAQLLDDSVATEVNHKTIYSDSIKFRKNKRQYDENVRLLKEFDAEPIYKFTENSVPPCDARDLEVCTSSENKKHSSFIRAFDLYNLPISAKDVPELKKILINKDLVDLVISAYTKGGMKEVQKLTYIYTYKNPIKVSKPTYYGKAKVESIHN